MGLRFRKIVVFTGIWLQISPLLVQLAHMIAFLRIYAVTKKDGSYAKSFGLLYAWRNRGHQDMIPTKVKCQEEALEESIVREVGESSEENVLMIEPHFERTKEKTETFPPISEVAGLIHIMRCDCPQNTAPAFQHSYVCPNWDIR